MRMCHLKGIKSKWLFAFTNFLVVICIYGPNVPSGSFTYSPKIPDEIKKLRKK